MYQDTAITLCLSDNIPGAAKKSIPRDFREDYKPYWYTSLANLSLKLSKARQNPNPGNMAKYNKLKEKFY